MRAASRTIVRIAGIWLVAAAAAAPGSAGERQAPRPAASRDLVSRADAARLRDKVAGIEQHAAAAPDPVPDASRPAPKATILSERELNSYLAFDAGSQIPVGVTSPRISILGDRRLAATALVDLDAVRANHKSSGWLDPLNYLSGRLPVALSGRLETADGVARFDLETASVSNIPIPKALVEELVAYYSRTPENPRGLSLDDSFLLPARIRRIDVRRGEAVVIQ